MTKSSHLETGNSTDRAGHDVDRIKIGRVVQVGAGLAVMVVVSMVGMAYLFRGLDEAVDTTLPAYASPPQQLQPPPPRVTPEQSKQLQELRAEHRRTLNSYGWVDEEAGIARIPIDRAIELVTQELPAREVDQ